jgi:hypothetical protein
LTARQISGHINHPLKAKALSSSFNGEPRMRNRLHVSFWGLHLTAEGIVAIAAALLIVVAVLAAYRF